MNILYIGPYRINDDDGYESLNYLLELKKTNHNIFSRPIYNQNSSILKIEEVEDILNRCETTDISHIDILIQHLTISNIDYTSKIKNHIYIPILNHSLCNFEEKQKAIFLSNKGKFIIRNNYHKIILDNIFNNLPIYRTIQPCIDENIFTKNSSGTFNFRLFNKYKKYYTIIDQSDEHNIKELIINFIKFNNNSKTNICLIIFIKNINKSRLDYYNDYIKNIYKILNINYSINKIILAPIDLNKTTISAIHNTGDIFIDLKQDIHSEYARFYNKIIYKINLDLLCKFDCNHPSSEQKISYFFSNNSIDFDYFHEIKDPNTTTLTKIIEKYV